jgi:hypothetical protein
MSFIVGSKYEFRESFLNLSRREVGNENLDSKSTQVKLPKPLQMIFKIHAFGDSKSRLGLKRFIPNYQTPAGAFPTGPFAPS